MQNKLKFKLIAGLLLAGLVSNSFGQSAIIRGEASAGVYQNIATDGAQNLRVSIANQASAGIVDPCASSAIVKSSVPINITSAGTTLLVGLSGTTVIYVCAFTVTVSQVTVTPNTLLFVSGTGAACSSSVVSQSGLLGDGGITAGLPLVISSGTGATLFKSPAGRGICATTAIGASGSFQGILTYVQQ